MITLKYLINQDTHLDIMTFFNWIITNFYAIFIVETFELFENMTNIDFLQSPKNK